MKNDNIGILSLVTILLGSYLIPFTYVILTGFTDIQTKVMISPTTQIEFSLPWYVNILTLSLLITSIIINYFLCTENKAVVTTFILSFSLSFGYIIFQQILSRMEFYSILILILSTGIIFTPLIIMVELMKQPVSEENIIGSILGLIYGVGTSSMIIFNSLVGFITALLCFIYFVCLYKAREIILSLVKPVTRDD